MNSVTIKVIGFIVSVFIILTVVSQIVLGLKDTPDVEEATFISVSDTVNFKGIFVRNETVLSGSANGVINFLYPDGSKIAKNSVIAKIYNSESEITTRQQLDEIENEISDLNKIINPGTEIIAQPEFLSTQIDQKYQELQFYIEEHNYDKIESLKSEISVLMNILNLVTGAEDKSVFENRIAYLQKTKTDLEFKLLNPTSVVESDNPGYFVSYTDGYENILNLDNINGLTASEIQNITDSNIVKSTENIGKVIDSYNSKIIAIVDLPGKFIKSSELSIQIMGSSYITPVKLESLTPIENTDKSILILSCNRLNYDLVQNRVENIDLVFNEYSGIKVPRKAIRFQDGEKGVYVAIGQDVRFKKLDVLYEGNDYVISRNVTDKQYVMLYDQILLEEVKQIETSSSSTQGTGTDSD